MRQTAIFPLIVKTTIALIFVGACGYGTYAARGFFLGPSITISEPTQYTITNNGALTISGKTERSELLTLNGKTVFTTPDGVFSERMLLTPGSNVFVIEAVDTFGTRHQKQITVAFTPHEPGSIGSNNGDNEATALVLLK